MRIAPIPRSRRPWFGLLLVALLAAWGVAPTARADDTPDAEAYEKALEYAEGIEKGLVDSIAEVRLNSVTVFNLRRPKPEMEPMRTSGGSGVIISRGGKLWILTNVHVTDKHDALEVVTHDGVIRPVIQHDSIPEYDIALLRFTEKPRKVKFRGVTVKPSKSGNGSSGLSEGTWVIATGNPFFLGGDGIAVATLGVVSGLNRFLAGEYAYVGAIQHDAEVNPGNSGGPLWNLQGDLVGINGKIFMGHRTQGTGPSNTGASFSLPIHQVDAFLKRLVGDDDAEAGFLGLETDTATDDKGKAVGAVITKIHPASPVNAKGQTKNAPKAGDVITSITVKGSSKRVYTASDLREIVSLLPAGVDVSLKFKSGNRSRRWKGKLGDKGR
jgi:serine protease Do